jgi:hypothetical protein
MNAEFTRWIIARRNHAAPICRTAHRQRQFAPFGVVAHFDGGIKTIAVDMDDFSLNKHADLAEQINVIVRSFYLEVRFFCDWRI